MYGDRWCLAEQSCVVLLWDLSQISPVASTPGLNWRTCLSLRCLISESVKKNSWKNEKTQELWISSHLGQVANHPRIRETIDNLEAAWQLLVQRTSTNYLSWHGTLITSVNFQSANAPNNRWISLNLLTECEAETSRSHHHGAAGTRTLGTLAVKVVQLKPTASVSTPLPDIEWHRITWFCSWNVAWRKSGSHCTEQNPSWHHRKAFHGAMDESVSPRTNIGILVR